MANRRRASPDAPGGSMGDVVEELEHEGHLTPRQRAAAELFLRHLKAYHGTSSGVVGELAEKVDASLKLPTWPAGSAGARMTEVEAMLKGMRQHERELLAFLVAHRELPRGSLADWGRQHSGYKTSKTRRAVTVGRITAFLDSLAEVCLPSPG